MLPLTLRDVTVRRRGKTVIGPLSLDVDGTGLTAIIGPNGAGKSTLLRVMHGIERLSAGHINWAIPMDHAQRHQSFVFQTPILLRRSVADNLRYPLNLLGQPPDTNALITQMAAQAGLSDHLTLPAHRLSGGERQKLALARALITTPKVLFLDEPCASLDGQATRAIETMLQAALASGTRILLATHDMGQVRRLATEAIFLMRGQVTGYGPDLLTHPPATLQAFLNGDIID